MQKSAHFQVNIQQAAAFLKINLLLVESQFCQILLKRKQQQQQKTQYDINSNILNSLLICLLCGSCRGVLHLIFFLFIHAWLRIMLLFLHFSSCFLHSPWNLCCRQPSACSLPTAVLWCVHVPGGWLESYMVKKEKRPLLEEVYKEYLLSVHGWKTPMIPCSWH